MEEILDALPAFGIHGLRSIPEPIPGLERFAQAFTAALTSRCSTRR
jgi:hypothetical protein